MRVRCTGRHLPRRCAGLLSLLLLSSCALLAKPFAAPASQTPTADSDASRAAPSVDVLATPLVFEANVGQFAPHVRFAARLQTGVMVITDESLTIDALDGFSSRDPGDRSRSPLALRFDGARLPLDPSGEGRSPTQVHYLTGPDAAGWRRGVPTFDRVRLPELYPGIDLVVYGNGRTLEYDFIVSPAADATRIGLSFDGADRVDLEADGTVTIVKGTARLRQGRPETYQVRGGRRMSVDAAYERRGPTSIAVRVGPHAADVPLVIDPVLAFATYLGGRSSDTATAVAVDAAGAIYVTGWTTPLGSGAMEFPRVNRHIGDDNPEVVIAKLDPTGQRLEWVTLVGGSQRETASSLAVGPDGSVYVTGNTFSSDFPVAGAYQPHCASCDPDPVIEADAFLFRLRPDGADLLFSTYFGGSSHDSAIGVVLDSQHRASIAGTTSVSCPLCSGEAFVATFSEDGSALVRSTLLGGPGGDRSTGVSIDAADNLYVAIWNDQGDFPFVHPVVAPPGGTTQVLVKLTPGGQISYATPLPVFAGDARVAALPDGRVVVAGQSYVLPATSASQRLGPLGRSDLVVMRLDAAATTFTGPFFLGGSDDDRLRDVAVDASGIAWLVGASASTNFPWAGRVQAPATHAIFRSDDGGRFLQPAPVPAQAGGVLCFAAARGSSTVFAGSRFDGVLRSADRGRTWSTANRGLEGLEVWDVAVDPHRPATAFAVAQGDIYKTTDEGDSWVRTWARPAMPELARVVAVSPSVSSSVLAGTDTGVYVSRDGGLTWRISMTGMPLPTIIQEIVADPALPSHIFARTTRGLYISVDNGQRWVPGGAGLPSYDGNSVSSFVIDPSTSPPRLYAAAPPDGLVYWSGNFGASWGRVTTQSPAAGYHGVRTLALGQGAPSSLYAIDALGTTWSRSDDGGITWVSVGTGLSAVTFHAIDALTFLTGRDPDPDGVIAGVDLDTGSIVQATPIGGSSWDELASVAVDPSGDLVVAGAVYSRDLPVVNALQPSAGGQPDMLVAKMRRDADVDGDGLSDAWEQQMGLTVGVNDAAADPDADGATNAEELARGTHPRGFHTDYLAEGATGAFFQTLIAVVNPDPAATAHVWLRFEDATGTRTGHPLLVPPLGRRTVDVGVVAGLQQAEFGTVVESDVAVAVSRTMLWDRTGYGGHAGQAVAASPRWYFAEGATTAGFQLFYLLDNPNDADAEVRVTWLVADGRAPLEETDVVAAHSRLTIWVNQVPGLAHAELGARFVTDASTPIVVERAMYLDTGGQTFGAGHAAAGVTAPATEWFVAEGATGSFFDLFLLLANPGTSDATIDVTYLRSAGDPIVKRHVVRAGSRYTIWVDQEDSRLTDTAVAAHARAIDDVPFVMERVMWWPGPTAATWNEAHAAPATRETGTLWVAPDGLIRGSSDAATYLLIANTGLVAALAEVTLTFEDGSHGHATFPVPPRSRTNVSVRDEAWTFDSAADAARFAIGGRFGALIESAGPAVPLVVETAVYWNAPGVDRQVRAWAAGTSTGAVKVR